MRYEYENFRQGINPVKVSKALGIASTDVTVEHTFREDDGERILAVTVPSELTDTEKAELDALIDPEEDLRQKWEMVIELFENVDSVNRPDSRKREIFDRLRKKR